MVKTKSRVKFVQIKIKLLNFKMRFKIKTFRNNIINNHNGDKNNNNSVY